MVLHSPAIFHGVVIPEEELEQFRDLLAVTSPPRPAGVGLASRTATPTYHVHRLASELECCKDRAAV
jgi:hypothetical protein